MNWEVRPTVLGRNFPMYGDAVALAIFGSALFLVPFPLGALYLRARFRDTRRPAVWVTLGLLGIQNRLEGFARNMLDTLCL